MATKEKNYARITTYGNLLVPIEMLDKIVSEGFIASTTYSSDKELISEIKRIDKVTIHGEEELEQAKVQMALEGKDE